MQANILVTGGAGYIGSHVVKQLVKANAKKVVVLDDLSTGFADSVKNALFIQGSIQDTNLVSQILAQEKITAILHFAASTIISESLNEPLKYYQNNAMGTLNLLQVSIPSVKHFIFSSTAAVYGPTQTPQVNETHPLIPLNPYARSKLMAEQILIDAAKSNPLSYAIMRYFNVAGADPSGTLGQKSLQVTHLVKSAVQTACGIKAFLPVFGRDYPTPDGTCIRDFIHVSDLAKAHVQALAYLMNGGDSVILNCGYGHGFSVQDVINSLEKITGHPLNTVTAPRRDGDLPCVVADNTKIKTLLDWTPEFDDLTTIVKTTLRYEQNLMMSSAQKVMENILCEA